METFDHQQLKQLYVPSSDSHKGQNGKMMIVGGSHLFHSASLWALTIASKLVDMVFYSSVPENNQIVQKAKQEFRDGIVVPRTDVENYMREADCVLIGPGMLRSQSEISNLKSQISKISEINEMKDEGMQSYYLTKYLLAKYPDKKWVIDAGALQMMEPEWLLPLNGQVILTPHPGEFERVSKNVILSEAKNLKDPSAMPQYDKVKAFAKKYNCIILLKGEKDLVCSPEKCVEIPGGNAGMTKGGTGDVLAGLVAGLACKNDLFLAALAGSYINKKTGEVLYKKVGYHFNASDLANEIPVVMKQLLL